MNMIHSCFRSVRRSRIKLGESLFQSILQLILTFIFKFNMMPHVCAAAAVGLLGIISSEVQLCANNSGYASIFWIWYSTRNQLPSR